MAVYFCASVLLLALIGERGMAFAPVSSSSQPCSVATLARKSQSPFLCASENDSEDDGWGDESSSIAAAKEEIDALRAKPTPTTQKTEEERDLFIPIFTLVSVIGFGGLYAYETLRLYLNGELYLPGN